MAEEIKLSKRIREAMRDHAKEYPNGDWKGVNERLSHLYFEAEPILIEAGYSPREVCMCGNEGRAKYLEKLGH